MWEYSSDLLDLYASGVSKSHYDITAWCLAIGIATFLAPTHAENIVGLIFLLGFVASILLCGKRGDYEHNPETPKLVIEVTYLKTLLRAAVEKIHRR